MIKQLKREPTLSNRAVHMLFLALFLCLSACEDLSVAVHPGFFRVYEAIPGDISVLSVEEMPDGYIILARQEKSQMMLVKVNQHGDRQWVRVFRDYYVPAREVQINKAGNLLIPCAKLISTSKAVGAVIEISTDGIIVSEKLFSNFTYSAYLTGSLQRGWGVLGYDTATRMLNRMHLAHLNPSGQTDWEKSYNYFNGTTTEGSSSIPVRLIQHPEGGYTAVTFNPASPVPLVVRFDENGNLDSEISKVRLRDLDLDSTGNYIGLVDAGITGVYLRKYDKFMNELFTENIWLNEVNAQRRIFIRVPDDSTYLVLATSIRQEIAFHKFNYKGELLLKKFYGTSNEYNANFIRPTKDKGYIIVGTTRINNNSELKKICLIKVNAQGSIGG